MLKKTSLHKKFTESCGLLCSFFEALFLEIQITRSIGGGVRICS